MGVGYVGLVTGACLANLGHKVICVDIDENKISKLNLGEIHFYEPGLKEVVDKNVDKGRLFFTTDTKEAIESAEVIFNCVGTPSNEDGSANLEYVFAVAREVARVTTSNKLLVNKSTVPPGTAARCQQLVKETNPDSQVELVSNPEFLKEGSAVYDFTHPDKIVIGSKSERCFNVMRKLYSGLERPYMNLLETNWETAEMIKYANNSFLATKISFINEIANICEVVGADVKFISKAIGMDYRISPKFLNAGIGYAGSCFPKDVRALVGTAREQGYEAKLLQEVNQLNERQKRIILNKIKKKYGEELSGKTFSILGLSFKPKTSDIREAVSLILIDELLKLGAKIRVYDPIANNEVKLVFGERINYCESIDDVSKDSNGLILVTEWDEFRNVDFNQIGDNMVEKVLFDGRNIYEPSSLINKGFEYYGIGRK